MGSRVKACVRAALAVLGGVASGTLSFPLLTWVFYALGGLATSILFPEVIRQQAARQHWWQDVPPSPAVPFLCLGGLVLGWAITRLYRVSRHLARGFLVGYGVEVLGLAYATFGPPPFKPAAVKETLATLFTSSCVTIIIALYAAFLLRKADARHVTDG